MKTHTPITAVVCGGLNLLRCFADKGLAVTVAGWDPEEPALHSRWCRQRLSIPNPATEPQRTLETLLSLGQQMPWRPALFYDTEPMLLLAARNRQALEPYYRFLVPEQELVEDMTNKVRFANLAERLELPVPRTLLSRQCASAREALSRISLPCIFKPISHVGWYDTEIVKSAGAKPFKALLASTPEQFGRLWEKMTQYASDFVVQEYVPGGDDCIYSFHAYFDEHSRALGYYVGRKIRTYPKVSGISTYLELVKEPDLERLGLEILGKMRFTGAVKLDFKKDPARNRFYLLEINSRFNLWNYLGAACGVNLPWIAYLNLHGQACEPLTEYRTDIRWISFDNDVRAFLRDYHPDGDLSWTSWLWSLRSRKICNVFCWRDPVPFAFSLLGYARKSKKYWRQISHRLHPASPPPPALGQTPTAKAAGKF